MILSKPNLINVKWKIDISAPSFPLTRYCSHISTDRTVRVLSHKVNTFCFFSRIKLTSCCQLTSLMAGVSTSFLQNATIFSWISRFSTKSFLDMWNCNHDSGKSYFSVWPVLRARRLNASKFPFPGVKPLALEWVKNWNEGALGEIQYTRGGSSL